MGIQRTELGTGFGYPNIFFNIANLREIALLSPSDGAFIVGNGSDFITESGNIARTSLGLGTGDSPTFTNLTLSGQFNISTAVSKIVPGITSLALRNNADTFNNLILTDAGAATFRNTVDGITTLSFATLGSAVNLNSQALTNANIDSGTIDDVILGGTLAGSPTLSGTITFSAAAPIILSNASPTVDANSATANLTIIAKRTAVNAGTAITIQTYSNLNAASTRLTISSGVATAVATWSNITHSGFNATSPTITASPTAAGSTWADLGSVTTIDINGGTVDGTTIGATTPATGIFTTLTVNTNANPAANNGAGLGTGLLGWSGLFLASGTTINFANSNLTITHSAGLLTIAGTVNATTLQESGNAVPNATDNLSFFAATTSAQLAGVISDETGSGLLVFGTSPNILTSLTSSSTTFALLNATVTTLNLGGAVTTLNLGAAAVNINLTAGAFVLNENAQDLDVRIESLNNPNMFVLDAGLNVVAFGGAADPSNMIKLLGTFAGSSMLNVSGTLTPSANANSRGILIDVSITEAASGNHTLLAGVHIVAPVITAGVATVTDTASFYISNAPTATVSGANYAIWIDAGLARLDGVLNVYGNAASSILDVNATSIVINENSLDIDFRIESDTNVNAFVVDAGLNGGVGEISLGSPASDPGLNNQNVFGYFGHTAITAIANYDWYTYYIVDSGAVTIPVGTSALGAALRIDGPTFTNVGTLTTGAALMISGVSINANTNYGLLARMTGTIGTIARFENTTNTAVAAHSIVDVAVGGTTSTGDSQYRVTVPGGVSYYFGSDNSALGDPLSIGNGTSVGAGGGVTIASAAGNTYTFLQTFVGNINYTGTTQVTALGIVHSFSGGRIVGDTATLTVDAYTSVYIQAWTQSTNVTLTRSAAITLDQTGAGNATHVVGLHVFPLTAGSTSNLAIWVQNPIQLGNATVNTTANQFHTASQGAASTTMYIGNASINVTSDSRLKKNISPTAINAFNFFNKLEVIDYDWNDPSEAENSRHNKASRGRWTGITAQNLVKSGARWLVNAVDPNCEDCLNGSDCTSSRKHEGHSDDHSSPWGVDLVHMAGLFVKGFQEATVKFNLIDERIIKLETELAELKAARGAA